jgi:hypothetical protein
MRRAGTNRAECRMSHGYYFRNAAVAGERSRSSPERRLSRDCARPGLCEERACPSEHGDAGSVTNDAARRLTGSPRTSAAGRGPESSRDATPMLFGEPASGGAMAVLFREQAHLRGLVSRAAKQTGERMIVS